MSRTVLITGASSGFGLGVALALAERGWRVLATLRDIERAPAILKSTANVELLQADLAHADQVHALAQRVLERSGGKLDCVVNNAGYGLNGPLESLSDAQMRRQFEVNFFALASIIRELIPALEAARGRVINLSSMAGETGMPLGSLYCASKHAIDGLSQALRHELAPRGVQVTVVAPGGFRTQFGTNVTWGELPVTSPIAQQQIATLQAIWKRMRTRPGADPQRVVQLIVSLAERRRVPPIVRIGRDALAVHALYRLLPIGAAEAVLGIVYRSMMRQRERLERDA